MDWGWWKGNGCREVWRIDVSWLVIPSITYPLVLDSWIVLEDPVLVLRVRGSEYKLRMLSRADRDVLQNPYSDVWWFAFLWLERRHVTRQSWIHVGWCFYFFGWNEPLHDASKSLWHCFTINRANSSINQSKPLNFRFEDVRLGE